MNCRTAQRDVMAYIERKLPDAELEEFLEHVANCPECSEELEVSFTVYYALRKLDRDDTASFDIKELLQQDMEQQWSRVRQKASWKFAQRFLCVLIGMLLAVFLLTGIEGLRKGGLSGTTLYRWIIPEAETETEAVTEALTATQTETTEPETNHKKQVVITVPETEQATEPGPLPTNPKQ